MSIDLSIVMAFKKKVVEASSGVKSEIKEEVNKEVNKEVKSEVKKETTTSLKTEPKKEVKTEPKKETNTPTKKTNTSLLDSMIEEEETSVYEPTSLEEMLKIINK